MFNLKNKLIWKRPTETNEVVEDDDLKNTNVDFAEKYGKVNALTITTNGNVVLDNREDTQSITENGKTEFNINDNYILSYSTEDFIDEIFNEVNGLEYYLYDIDSTGLLIFEPLDIFTFRHNGVDYKTIMFNDDIKLTQGLVETTYAERQEETEKDYVTTDKNENKLNNAIISLDKANAKIKLNTDAISQANASIELNSKAIDTTNSQIVLKANAQGKIVQVKLESDASAGSTFTIDADQIDLNANDVLNILSGNEINLKSKNITIKSDRMMIDKTGVYSLYDSNENKIAEFNGNGIDFFKNNNRTIRMGVETIKDTSVGPGGGQSWDAATTSVEYGQSIWWTAQRSSGSQYYDPVMWYTNGLSKGLTIRANTVFNNEYTEFVGKIKGNLSFTDSTNAGVVTTSLSNNDNLWISRLTTDGVGNLLATSWLGTITVSGKISDKRFKKNIKLSKENALDKIKKIKIYSFDFKKNNEHINNGFVAQQLEKIDSNLVIKNDDGIGIYQVNDLNMLSLAVKAIQEQQSQIEELKEEIEKLKDVINNG